MRLIRVGNEWFNVDRAVSFAFDGVRVMARFDGRKMPVELPECYAKEVAALMMVAPVPPPAKKIEPNTETVQDRARRRQPGR